MSKKSPFTKQTEDIRFVLGLEHQKFFKEVMSDQAATLTDYAEHIALIHFSPSTLLNERRMIGGGDVLAKALYATHHKVAPDEVEAHAINQIYEYNCQYGQDMDFSTRSFDKMKMRYAEVGGKFVNLSSDLINERARELLESKTANETRITAYDGYETQIKNLFGEFKYELNEENMRKANKFSFAVGVANEKEMKAIQDGLTEQVYAEIAAQTKSEKDALLMAGSFSFDRRIAGVALQARKGENVEELADDFCEGHSYYYDDEEAFLQYFVRNGIKGHHFIEEIREAVNLKILRKEPAAVALEI